MEDLSYEQPWTEAGGGQKTVPCWSCWSWDWFPPGPLLPRLCFAGQRGRPLEAVISQAPRSARFHLAQPMRKRRKREAGVFIPCSLCFGGTASHSLCGSSTHAALSWAGKPLPFVPTPTSPAPEAATAASGVTVSNLLHRTAWCDHSFPVRLSDLLCTHPGCFCQPIL